MPRPIDAEALYDALYDNEFQTFCPLDEVSDVIAKMPTLDYVPRQQWISVEAFLPEDEENLHFYDDGQLCFTSVLVHDKKRGTVIANRLMIRHHKNPAFDELATEGWVWSRPHEPTHWMPLPLAPKEEA